MLVRSRRKQNRMDERDAGMSFGVWFFGKQKEATSSGGADVG